MSESHMNDDEFNQLYDRIADFYNDRNPQNVEDDDENDFVMPPDNILNHDIMSRLNEEQNEQIQTLIEGFNTQLGNMGEGIRRKSRRNKGKRRKTHRKKSRRSRGKRSSRGKRTRRLKRR